MAELALSKEEKEKLIFEMETTDKNKINHPMQIFEKINVKINSLGYQWKWGEFLILFKEFYGLNKDND